MTRTTFSSLTALAALLLAPAAHAQTVITGHHDNGPTPPGNGDGYDAFSGSFVVPTDTGTALDATFNNNIASQYGGLVTYNAAVVVFGGTFSGNKGSAGGGGAGIYALGTGNVSIYGGTYSGNLYDFAITYVGTTPGVVPVGMDIFGSFTNPTTGQPLSPGQSLTLGNGIFGNGTFTGTLANNTVSQTYKYNSYRANITLHDVAPAPEPSAWAALVIGALGLGTLTLRARRRAC